MSYHKVDIMSGIVKKTKAIFQILAVVVVSAAVTGCCDRRQNIGELSGKYPDHELPDSIPTLFGSGVVSTSHGERDAAFTPDGNEFYFSKKGPVHYAILFMKRNENRWSKPQLASFSGRYSDLEPFVSADGDRLYFSSNRPISGTGEPKDYDIWMVERTDEGWSEPVNLGAPVNTSEDEFYPSVAKNGNLYVTARYGGSLGAEDIFLFRKVNGTYEGPENLGDSINSKLYEYNAYIAPDESYLIFGSHGREDGLGGGDLYISFRNEQGIWCRAINMGESINSNRLDYCPLVTVDGEFLFFTSNRVLPLHYAGDKISYDELEKILDSPLNGQDNIFWVSGRIIEKYKCQ